MAKDYIEVYGARVHNLKNIDIKIPRNQLVVLTGLSGSGKSSLAFDTIYAEGQRRYIETFSAYARQFLGGMERPDVDKIEGLSPVIAIEQKTTNKNPRSTVGTITEIYDFLRLLYARASTAISYNTGQPMVQYSNQQIKSLIKQEYLGKKIILLSPLVRSRKGHYRELFESVAKRGFAQVRTNGNIQDIERGMKLDRYKTHDVEVVIDKLLIKEDSTADKRLEESIEMALYEGNGVMMLLNVEENSVRFFSKDLMCPSTGISYPMPEPNSFSFNSPKGACSTCNGIGFLKEMDLDKIINPKLSLAQGAIVPLTHLKHTSRISKQIKEILEKNKDNAQLPFGKLSQESQNNIVYGTTETVDVQLKFADVSKTYKINFEGIINYLERLTQDKNSSAGASVNRKYTKNTPCPKCNGTRLRKESRFFVIGNKNIAQASQLDLNEFYQWVQSLPKTMSKKQKAIGEEILKEIQTRTQFLLDVGLQYLSLNRPTKSLSGGEAQRIRLATQIGSQLVNVLYILDEPSIGLHQRDNERLIQSLQNLRDIGNSVLVVEHDQDMILKADHVIDIGPKAGKKGGEIVWQGSPKQIKNANTLTADYLNQKRQIQFAKKQSNQSKNHIILQGASGNNLKNVEVKIPLNQLVVVTGVSGSGKSTLINETLFRILNQHFYRAEKEPMPYKSIKGIEHVEKVVDVDQSPIGRTPRSNPATYTGLFTEIRNIFAQLPESKIRGYKPGRFSFNVKGGRCETCAGGGLRVIEMNFLPDIYVPCETCQGKRFNRETLEVRYKGKSIADVLEMTVNEAVEFFEPIPKIYQKVNMLQQVGLGYISLGQQSTTLSGGEAQRIKLATELSKRQNGKTLYILDEPTTGLHFDDIRVLMEVIQKLVSYGNSVVIIEHNLDVIQLADYVIDLGPEGGKGGGTIVAQGSVQEIAKCNQSITGRFLQTVL